MEKKYLVFISSTYEDLKRERQKVIEAVLKLNYIPAGMEFFPAADARRESIIKQVIDQCDFFIVIIAGRYGEPREHGKSFTEFEYRYALSRKKPVIAFLRKDVPSLPAEKQETGKMKGKLDKFVNLAKRKLCRSWKTADELASEVVTSLTSLANEHSELGWIKSSLHVQLHRKDVSWSQFNDKVSRRFWACGTSLRDVLQRKLVEDFWKKGTRDIKILLPDFHTGSLSRRQLIQFNRVAGNTLADEQVKAAKSCYNGFAENIKKLALANWKQYLHLYKGIMYANITISDKEAVVAFYDSTGIGDNSTTLHIAKTGNPKAYEKVLNEFLTMWRGNR
jgi:hypothetical protein